MSPRITRIRNTCGMPTNADTIAIAIPISPTILSIATTTPSVSLVFEVQGHPHAPVPGGPADAGQSIRLRHFPRLGLNDLPGCNRHSHGTEPGDAAGHHIAGDDRTDPFRSAGIDQIARMKPIECRCELDQPRHAKNEITGRGLLTQNTIDQETQLQIVWIGDFITRCQPRTQYGI